MSWRAARPTIAHRSATLMADPAQLEADLAADTSLHSAWLTGRARKWFVKRIVAHAQAAADPAAKSRQYLQQAKGIVDAPSDRAYSFVVPDTRVGARALMVQIVYGALGVHPAVFLDQDNADLLRFVSERRLRTVLQMRDYVNVWDPDRLGNAPNERFDFPDDIEHSQLRSTATHWEGVSQVGPDKRWPFVLTPGADADRKAAVEELFRPGPRADADDVNVVECQTAASMVLLDSLLQADDPKQLFDALDQTGPAYLTIDNPDGVFRIDNGVPVGGLRILQAPVAAGADVALHVIPPAVLQPRFDVVLLDATGATETVSITHVKNPKAAQLLPPGAPATEEDVEKALVRTAAVPVMASELTAEQVTQAFDRGTRVIFGGVPAYHFLSDPRLQQGLFEQGPVPVDDLQPGDVVHVLGHPLTRGKIPTSGFGGERCVIIDPHALTGYLMRVSGHDVQAATLNGLALSALSEPNQLLTVARQILDNCLDPTIDGVLAAQGTSADANDGLREVIGRAVGAAPAVWGNPGFYTNGTWQAHDFPAITGSDLDWWADLDDPLDGFGGYPKHWALAVQGNLLIGDKVVPLGAGGLFVFGYWPSDPVDDDLSWPTEQSRNFVGLFRSAVHNVASLDPKLKYVIPYFDDQSALLLQMPLYGKVDDSAPVPTVLTYDDLTPQLFNLATDDGEAWVLRPRVSADPAYLAHLRAIGALP
ncbi:hypothetical protein ACGFZQ_12940 [Streptomyces sp. NPDC048254]|uniref:hypothetical protein n=1 Tax=Streptomyces sp. NPDC048254 TaxID=3365525 RepID=UPI003720D359